MKRQHSSSCVMQNFLAPAKIDPRMFDAGFVFSEIEEPSYKLDIANPKKKRKAEVGDLAF